MMYAWADENLKKQMLPTPAEDVLEELPDNVMRMSERQVLPGVSPSSLALEAGASRDPLNDFLARVEHQAYRMARHALWDHELALDVVQDSMLRLIERYKEKSAAEWPPLFFTILNNRINDARRARRLRDGISKVVSLFGLRKPADGQDEADPAELEIEDGAGSGPEQLIAGRRIGDHIDHAVGQLAPRQREVFLLRELQGLSVQETAQALGCAEGSVKQHHFRALQSLRRLLAEVWDHEKH
jgi:RNA polymerase sigma-70 factor (ECF subfamily)